MTNLVKGYIRIEKQQKENTQFYKRKIATFLWTLLASYKALSREVYLHGDTWDPSNSVSMLHEEPQEFANEEQILYDFEKRDPFIEHHSQKGWNKHLCLEFLMDNVEEIYEDKSYADEGDFVHWIRKVDGKTKHLDVYLLKFVEHTQFCEQGVDIFSGVMLAEKYSFEIYEKIKRVLERFSGILNERRVVNSATIISPKISEILSYGAQKPVWIRK